MAISLTEAYTGRSCPRCSFTAHITEVHGHIQCGHCHLPLLTCCEGAPLYDPGNRGLAAKTTARRLRKVA